MRTYTERSIVEGGAAKADDLNREYVGAVRQINGGIGQHQVPLEGVAHAHFQPPALVTPAAYDNTVSVTGPANNWHRTVDNNMAIELDPSGDALTGWTPIYTVATNRITAGSVIEFIAREGMLRGSWQIDFERRTSYISRNDGAITFPYTHREDWTRFGIFRNGTLIADSGNIYPKRFTLDLPFSCPVADGYTRLEVRFRAKTQQYADGTFDGITWSFPVAAEQYPSIFIHAGSGWVKNRFR